MTSDSPLKMFRCARTAAQEGRRDEALRHADAYSAAAVSQLLHTGGFANVPGPPSPGPFAIVDGDSPASSQLLIVAPIQNLYMAMGEWELAALKGADVCALAEASAPNTTATAGDYSLLADALERKGDPAGALHATETAVRHLKGAGAYDEYADSYERRLQKLRQLCEGAAASSDEEERFWRNVRGLCVGHVQRMIRYFDSHGANRMEFARPRFEQLVSDEVTDQVLSAARALLAENPDGRIVPVPVVMAGSWLVVLSVLPSAQDKDFLAACPEKSYPKLAKVVREQFRHTDGWTRCDFAHWILLLEQPDAASIHLHTHWSLFAHLKWLADCEDSARPVFPPSIVPADLLGDAAGPLYHELLRQDVEAWQEARQDSH